MANTSNYNEGNFASQTETLTQSSPLTITTDARRALSSVVFSTLLQTNILLALLVAWNHRKPDSIIGVGDPDTSLVLGGSKLPDTMIREIEECNSYTVKVAAIEQDDAKKMAYRDVNPTLSLGTTTAVSLTPTVVNGVITAVTVANGGSGFSGTAPTILAVDTTGFGAAFTATISGGAITVVTVLTGGQGYGTSPTILCNTGYSEGEKYRRPEFKWCEMKNTGVIYNRDISAAKDVAGADDKYFDAKMESLIQDSMTTKISSQAKIANTDLWFGTPSSQTAAIWDAPFGILEAVDDGVTSNTWSTVNYAGVDRSDATNYWYRGHVDTTQHAFGAVDLINDALYTKGLAFIDTGPDVFIVGPKLFAKYQKELTAQTQEVNTGPDLRMIGQYGFRNPALRYGNTWIVGDNRCPAGVAVGLSMDSWMIAFKKGKKFTPSQLYDQTGIAGGIDGSIFYVNTQWMPMCVAPPANIKYTNLL